MPAHAQLNGNEPPLLLPQPPPPLQQPQEARCSTDTQPQNQRQHSDVSHQCRSGRGACLWGGHHGACSQVAVTQAQQEGEGADGAGASTTRSCTMKRAEWKRHGFSSISGPDCSEGDLRCKGTKGAWTCYPCYLPLHPHGVHSMHSHTRTCSIESREECHPRQCGPQDWPPSPHAHGVHAGQHLHAARH
jgi:hypothetical protein